MLFDWGFTRQVAARELRESYISATVSASTQQEDYSILAKLICHGRLSADDAIIVDSGDGSRATQ